MLRDKLVAVRNSFAETGMSKRPLPSTTARENTFDPAKKNQGMRDAVLQFFSEFASKGGRGDCVMSMPGDSWAFENTYWSAFPYTRFLGVDRNEKTFLHSVRFAPGRGGGFLQMDAPGCVLDCYKNNISTMVCADLYDLMSLSRCFSGKRKNNHSLSAWYSIKKSNTAFWFDTCSTLSKKTLTAISVVERWCPYDRSDFPVAITFARCFDGLYSDSDRLSLVLAAASALNAFKPTICEAINYSGINGMPMCMVMLKLQRKGEIRLNKISKRALYAIDSYDRPIAVRNARDSEYA